MGGIPIIFHKQRSGYKCETGEWYYTFQRQCDFFKHANLSYTKRKRFKQKNERVICLCHLYIQYTFEYYATIII